MASTAQKPKGITTSKDVLRGNLQGAALAVHIAERGTKSSGGKKKGKAKRRLKKPPIGGWKGTE